MVQSSFNAEQKLEARMTSEIIIIIAEVVSKLDDGCSPSLSGLSAVGPWPLSATPASHAGWPSLMLTFSGHTTRQIGTDTT